MDECNENLLCVQGVILNYLMRQICMCKVRLEDKEVKDAGSPDRYSSSPPFPLLLLLLLPPSPSSPLLSLLLLSGLTHDVIQSNPSRRAACSNPSRSFPSIFIPANLSMQMNGEYEYNGIQDCHASQGSSMSSKGCMAYPVHRHIWIIHPSGTGRLYEIIRLLPRPRGSKGKDMRASYSTNFKEDVLGNILQEGSFKDGETVRVCVCMCD